MKAIVYTRHRTKSFYHYVSDRVFGSENVVYVSDDKLCEEIDLMKLIYGKLRWIKKHGISSINIDESEINDIIMRCRFLRSQAKDKAAMAIYSVWTVMQELIDKERPDIVFGLPVDSYVLDILYRVCRYKGIRYISVVPTLVNGYIRFTSRGEFIKLREPGEGEVNSILELLLKKDYIPKHIPSKKRTAFEFFMKYYLKDKIKKAVFKSLIFINKDYLNFYLNSHFSNEYLMICDNIKNIFPYKYFDEDWEQKLRGFGNLPVVYMPLQFYPETSTDYWTVNGELTDYYSILLGIIDKLDQHAVVLVKEHPAALGYRSVEIYNKLKQRKNVIMVPATVPSLTVIDIIDAAITWGTSTAVEARIRNKTAITIGKPFFNAGNCFRTIDHLAELDNIVEILKEELDNNRECDIKELVRTMLEASFPGTVYPGAIDFKPTDSQKRINVEGIVENFKKYLEVLL